MNEGLTVLDLRELSDDQLQLLKRGKEENTGYNVWQDATALITARREGFSEQNADFYCLHLNRLEFETAQDILNSVTEHED